MPFLYTQLYFKQGFMFDFRSVVFAISCNLRLKLITEAAKIDIKKSYFADNWRGCLSMCFHARKSLFLCNFSEFNTFFLAIVLSKKIELFRGGKYITDYEFNHASWFKDITIWNKSSNQGIIIQHRFRLLENPLI